MKISSFLILVCSSALVITACNKSASTTITIPDPTIEVSTQSDDQSRVSGEMDAVANDANTALDSSSNIGGKVDGASGICDATVVADTLSNPRTLTISYNGANCYGNRTRSGVVVLSMPAGTHWKDAGASVTIQIQNLRITRLADNKTITINGTKTMTNVTGGLLKNLATLQHITHTVSSSGLSITFDDGTQRTWMVARKRDFTYSNGIAVSETGTHTEGTATNVAEWGTDRAGHAFTTATTSPIVIRQDCNFRIVSGEVQHVLPNATATATFGLDANGAPTSCPATGHYYLKVSWTWTGGTTKSIILPY